MSQRPHHYIAGVDLLRFLAAFLVMVFHLAFWAWAFPDGQVARASHSTAAFPRWELLTASGWAGVQIFFVISGFVIAVSSERATAFGFFVSRFARLVPGVWICATLTLAAWAFIQVDDFHPHLIEYLRSLIFYPDGPWIDSVYWTLGIEIAFYGLVLVLVALRRFDRLKSLMCALGLLSTLYWFAWAVSPPDSAAAALVERLLGSRIAQLLLLQHGMFFALGVLLWRHLLKKQSADQLLWMAVFIAGGCLQIVAETSVNETKTGIPLSALGPIVVWLASLVVLYVSVEANHLVRQPGALRVLRRLGLMTYPLYLLHNVVGGSIMGVIGQWGAPAELALAGAMVAVLALSWWVSAVPEPLLQRAAKMRLMTFGSRLGVPQRPPATD